MCWSGNALSISSYKFTSWFILPPQSQRKQQSQAHDTWSEISEQAPRSAPNGALSTCIQPNVYDHLVKQQRYLERTCSLESYSQVYTSSLSDLSALHPHHCSVTEHVSHKHIHWDFYNIKTQSTCQLSPVPDTLPCAGRLPQLFMAAALPNISRLLQTQSNHPVCIIALNKWSCSIRRPGNVLGCMDQLMDILGKIILYFRCVHHIL